jgi:hypothetical protein
MSFVASLNISCLVGEFEFELDSTLGTACGLCLIVSNSNNARS